MSSCTEKYIKKKESLAISDRYRYSYVFKLGVGVSLFVTSGPIASLSAQAGHYLPLCVTI